MLNLKELHPRFITDEIGKKTAVIIDISDFEELMEDIEDLAFIAERRDENSISHDDLKKELRKNGLI